MSLGTMVRGCSLAASASTISGWRARRRSSVAAPSSSAISSGGVARRSSDSRALASMRSSSASTSRFDVDARQLVLDEPRQLRQDAPLLLRHLELGQLQPVVEVDHVLGLDEHRLPRLRRAVHDAAHLRARVDADRHDVALLALREEAVLQVRRDVRAVEQPLELALQLLADAQRVAAQAARAPARRDRAAAPCPSPSSKLSRMAPDTSSRSLMSVARPSRRGASRCAQQVPPHARARRQRQRHVAQRLRLERARLGRALQRLVDVAHAPVGAEERQRLADVAQRARLGHLLVARPRRVEVIVERQRARQRLAARRLPRGAPARRAAVASRGRRRSCRRKSIGGQTTSSDAEIRRLSAPSSSCRPAASACGAVARGEAELGVLVGRLDVEHALILLGRQLALAHRQVHVGRA